MGALCLKWILRIITGRRRLTGHISPTGENKICKKCLQLICTLIEYLEHQGLSKINRTDKTDLRKPIADSTTVSVPRGETIMSVI
jgi:hypothetical protein